MNPQVKVGVSMIAGMGLVAFGVLYGMAGITDIDPGDVGLMVKKFGSNRGMQEEILRAGTRWVDPVMYDTPIYNYQARQYNEGLQNVETQTKDGQPVVVDISLEISLNPALVPHLHENIGRDYYNEVVYPAVRSAIRDEVPSEESEFIYTSEGRKKVQKKIQTIMTDKFKHRGINIIVNLRDIDFTNSAFIATLEQKAGAAQQVIIETRNAEAAEQQAIKMANLAEGEKQKRIRAAEALQEEIRLEGLGQRQAKEEEAKGNLALAQAEAEGRRLLNEAMDGPGGDKIVAIEWARNMGPNVKVYGFPTGSPGTSSIMDLNGLMKGAFSGVGK